MMQFYNSYAAHHTQAITGYCLSQVISISQMDINIKFIVYVKMLRSRFIMRQGPKITLAVGKLQKSHQL